MSEEINVGDIRVNLSDSEFEVVGRHGEFFWTKWKGSKQPITHSMDWMLNYSKPKPTFFEENATYQHKVSRSLWEVKLVIAVDGEHLAIMKSPTTKRLFTFDQERWDQGYFEKV